MAQKRPAPAALPAPLRALLSLIDARLGGLRVELGLVSMSPAERRVLQAQRARRDDEGERVASRACPAVAAQRDRALLMEEVAHRLEAAALQARDTLLLEQAGLSRMTASALSTLTVAPTRKRPAEQAAPPRRGVRREKRR